MRALGIFPGKRSVEIIDVDEPVIQDDRDVKVRIIDVGICGTDREISRFEYGAPPSGSDHLILGHEGFGEVVQIGPAVTEFEPGDLVVPMVRHPCPHAYCGPCRIGRQDFCVTGDFTESGIKQRHGFLRRYIVERPEFLVGVPAELKDIAVLTEPMTIAEKAFSQVAQIFERLPWYPENERPSPLRVHGDNRAVVLGAGPMGLLGAMRLRLAGYRTFVYSLETPESINARIALETGSEYTSARDQDIPEFARMVNHIDLVYEASGVSTVAFQLMKYIGQNGIFILTGVPAIGQPIDIDADCIMRNLVLRNQLVFGTVNAGHEDHEKAVRSLGLFREKWPRAVSSVIAARQGIEMFKELVQHRRPGIKHVIHEP